MRLISRAASLALCFMLLALANTLPATTAEAASSGCLPGVLQQRLQQIRAKFGPVSIISTHRPGATIAGSGHRSLHASCRAVDFHPSGNYGAVVAWLKANHSGGVGTYSCGMNHIHIDSGPYVRFHHCVNASGRPSGSSRHASRRHRSGSRHAAKQRRSGSRVATTQRAQRRGKAKGQQYAGGWTGGDQTLSQSF